MKEFNFKNLEINDFELFKPVNNTNIYEQYLKYKENVQILNNLNATQKKVLKDSGYIKVSKKTSKEFIDTSLINNKSLFRKSNSSNELLTQIWLSKVINDAKLIVLNNKIATFQKIDKDLLKKIAQLSIENSNIIKLPNMLLEYGIILIYEKCLPNTKLDGAVLTLSSGHPVIGISFRYSRLDSFWFTLLHELSHIVLHLDKLKEPIIDDFDDIEIDDDITELEANKLAKNSFVERHIWRTCEAKYNTSVVDVLKSFSEKININPVVIAGLLRYEKNDYTIYSKLINEFNVREYIFGKD
ncbi:ImmA/IrrE family metallo-endopeptidase [Aliarcobacter butzleri]|uniref:ImmA/IrrE family metallo-endopeptidase n=1 Tax=Aliarcobacter butzleri TaxID=28197 RepID=UPI003B226CA3